MKRYWITLAFANAPTYGLALETHMHADIRQVAEAVAKVTGGWLVSVDFIRDC